MTETEPIKDFRLYSVAGFETGFSKKTTLPLIGNAEKETVPVKLLTGTDAFI